MTARAVASLRCCAASCDKSETVSRWQGEGSHGSAPVIMVLGRVEGAAAVAAQRLVLRLKEAQSLGAPRTHWRSLHRRCQLVSRPAHRLGISPVASPPILKIENRQDGSARRRSECSGEVATGLMQRLCIWPLGWQRQQQRAEHTGTAMTGSAPAAGGRRPRRRCTGRRSPPPAAQSPCRPCRPPSRGSSPPTRRR